MALVPIHKLSPGNNQRQFFPEIVELAEAISESGWVAELLISEDGTIIAGERRYRACNWLNEQARRRGDKIPWPKLPCQIVKGSSDKQFDLNVAENMGRVQLRFIELASIFKVYRDKGLSNEQIGKKTGFAAETVSRYVNILDKCHPKIIQSLQDGVLIPIDTLIRLHTIPKEVQLLRLEQWQGIAPVTDVKESKQRTPKLSRRKALKLIQLLQEKGAAEETIQVAQFLIGQRTTLPGNLHLRLSRKSPMRRGE